MLSDPGSFVEHETRMFGGDPLGFVDRRPYGRRLHEARNSTGRFEAAVFGTAALGGQPVVLLVLDFDFLGGTMGVVVGEKFVRAADLAIGRGHPLITVSASGGGRVQEGGFALLQGAKTAATVARLREVGVPYISVLTDPVFGGVAVSFSSAGDVVLAEHGARAGFTGRQVIEGTVGQRLPEDFQTAEFLLDHGHVDATSSRERLAPTLRKLVAMTSAGPRPHEEHDTTVEDGTGAGVHERRDPWEAVVAARSPRRPRPWDHVARMTDDFTELRGDRVSGDDSAVLTGVGRIAQHRVALIAHRRGESAHEHNRGMARPSGYRKATRVMRLAGRWNLPVVTLVDTPGAYPGVESEEENQSEAIAETMITAARLPVPVICVITGEGGSGGGLAFCVGDRLLMQSNSVFSVISPEGAAALLHGDGSRASEAARNLGLTAEELSEHGLIDEVVPEPPEGADSAPEKATRMLRSRIVAQLTAHDSMATSELVRGRTSRLRTLGAEWCFTASSTADRQEEASR
ncbi:acetyl-CoA carboxylase carboxyl transferase subunit beta [Actinopolyspora biskrensis]|uniref:Acetyl-coenzyme A carboxylase carboxyl transferase subunits beta/alpha n=1 Tax=Actinopolyspora biskrensis TaxID=1470178 RepID=A0A852Z682_9ACTN|nr:acetyl-CoA carboxylase carboxyltransferase subunit alpha/beta [Actinopolyspora biskrensis]NYH77713.1 acetyl-CoA carboxylase carboxyl transferase subunit beta [Actinopolyspora biskrensis]